MAKLLITWNAPQDTRAIDSIVLYKKLGAADCNETLQGEQVYETTDFGSQSCRYVDEGVPDGDWRYAAFSKNPAGLSPCATSVYSVVTDTAPTVNNYLQDISADHDDSNLTINLANTFIDPQGDAITKTATSSDSSVVAVSVSGDDLILDFKEGSAGGNITITVTAEAKGKTVQDQFVVTVSATLDASQIDADGDGFTADIDPDDSDASIVLIAPQTLILLRKDYNFQSGEGEPTYGQQVGSDDCTALFNNYFNTYQTFSGDSLWSDAQGEKIAIIALSSARKYSVAGCYSWFNNEATSRADPSFPTPIFWREWALASDLVNHDPTPPPSKQINFGSVIVSVPFFKKDANGYGIWTNPFEWGGYYPLFKTQAEANVWSKGGQAAISHTFQWNSGQASSQMPIGIRVPGG